MFWSLFRGVSFARRKRSYDLCWIRSELSWQGLGAAGHQDVSIINGDYHNRDWTCACWNRRIILQAVSYVPAMVSGAYALSPIHCASTIADLLLCWVPITFANRWIDCADTPQLHSRLVYSSSMALAGSIATRDPIDAAGGLVSLRCDRTGCFDR